MTAPEDLQPVDPRPARIEQATRRWRQALADVGGRNTLLWHRDGPLGVLDLTVAHPSGTAKLLAANVTRLSELVREPHAFEEALGRALAVRRKAVELADEHGLRTCFLGIGTATWRIAGAVTPPRAPVLLRSCRIEPVDATYRDLVLTIGEDITFNPALTHYLQGQQGLDIDPAWLAGLSRGPHGFDARPAFDALEEICAELPGFAIAPQLVVSTFPWAKLGMVADVAAQEERIAGNEVLLALAGDTDARRGLQERHQRVQEEIAAHGPDTDPPALVLDADADQLRVVRLVRAGAHVVVEGAPGNGKTQTVANIAAALVADGKRVLVVAEKRAVLDGIRRRLDHAGLGDLVLPVGDDAVAAQRAATALLVSMDSARAETEGDTVGAAQQELASARERADAALAHLHADAQHAHRVRSPWGLSVQTAQQELTRLAQHPHPPVSRVRLRGADVRVEGLEALAGHVDTLAEAARHGAWSGGAQDPWWGAKVASTEEADAVLAAARRLAGEDLAGARQTMTATAESVGLPAPTTLAAWAQQLTLLEDVLVSLDTFVPAVFDVPLDDMVAATAEGAARDEDARDMGGFTRSRLRRNARKLLRPGPPPPDLHGLLRKAREQRQRWERLGGRLARPEAVRDIEPALAAHQRTEADVALVTSVVADDRRPDDLRALPFDVLAAFATALVEARDRLAVVPEVRAPLDAARAVGLGPVVDDLARRDAAADEVPDLMRYVWFASLLDEARGGAPRTEAGQAESGKPGGMSFDLGAPRPADADRPHDPDVAHKAWRTFLREDRAALRAQAALIGAGVVQRSRELMARSVEETDRVMRRLEDVTRPDELRQAWRAGGGLAPTLRPITMASPLVIGAALPVGRLFDVVIVAHAQALPVEHAVPAILRARQVVVVGDHRLPGPRPFTVVQERRVPGRPPQPTDRHRRALLDALAEVLPVQTLAHHYRALDERLVTPLERRVYPGAMRSTPGTLTVPPVVVDEVAGEGERQHDMQRERVVELVLDHARRRPHLSLGVVTFSAERAEQLETALREEIARSHEFATSFRERAVEAFFVRSAERVAGEVRDAVILDVAGMAEVAPGEEEALVVAALASARRRLHVVAPSFALADAPDGSPLALLTEASRPQPVPEPSTPGQPLLLDLADRLRREGLTVTAGYGRGADPVELAVFDPDQSARPLVAVLTDAPWGERLEILGDAATPAERRRLVAWSRDWERLRTEQLRRLGWAPVRIWSAELFADPARVVARVVRAAQEGSAARSRQARGERE